VPGIHNVLNALASIASTAPFGISFETCKKALLKFKGAKRRFEYKGKFNNITVIDDFAHHPTEVKATLAAAAKYPHNKIWCIFQPHTYSRTKALLDEFSECFDNADKIIIADIYAAREKDPGDISSKDLVEKLKKKGHDAEYVGSFEQIIECLKKNTNSNDVILTMGAGDIYKVGESLVNEK
jgi:UDP-N-acetylmuramate--alanine ligase